MMTKTELLNNLSRLLYKSEYKRFVSERDITQVQLSKLRKYLEENKDTEYGRKYNFGSIHSYQEFCEKVPLTTYEDYEPYIQKMKNGEKGILTADDVLLFELTSGSSGGKKFIPYTNSLKKEFQKGIHPWLYDLYTHAEGVRKGKSYWSITPITTKKEYTAAGIPVGFEEDVQYFGKIEQHIMKQLFAVDSSKVKFVKDMKQFYYDTALQLLDSKKVSLISVWNPTFLTLLWDFMEEHEERLTAQTGVTLAELKKEIKLISCWADGSAKEQIQEVYNRFPDAVIQPKGVLATEAFISFPLVGEEGSRLSVDSHFFEFRNLETEEVCMVDGLKEGQYEIILTTGGGFYRYQIGDILEILQVYEHKPPRVRFLRRKGITTDLCGEKLTEEFVCRACIQAGIEKDFCLLSPEKDRYILYTTNTNITAKAFDNILRESFHYDYCRELRQLQMVQVVVVNKQAREQYFNRLTESGMRLGDIKPSYLSGLSDWGKWLGCPHRG